MRGYLFRTSRRLGKLQGWDSEVIFDEGHRREHDDVIRLGLNNLHLLGALGLALDLDALALELRVPLLLVVDLHALQEGLITARLLAVLRADVDALLQLPVSHNL